MATIFSKYSLLIFIVFYVGVVHAQKDIVINQSLAANAEKLKVKMGSQEIGKIRNFKFGEYAVVSSKMGWTTTSSKSNIFNTKIESTSTQKFSFIEK